MLQFEVSNRLIWFSVLFLLHFLLLLFSIRSEFMYTFSIEKINLYRNAHAHLNLFERVSLSLSVFVLVYFTFLFQHVMIFTFYRLHSFLFVFVSYLFTDPPSAPIISGYVEGSIIPAGSVQKLVCISSGGNPLATLTWYKNDKKVSFLTGFHLCFCIYVLSQLSVALARTLSLSLFFSVSLIHSCTLQCVQCCYVW